MWNNLAIAASNEYLDLNQTWDKQILRPAPPYLPFLKQYQLSSASF